MYTFYNIDGPVIIIPWINWNTAAFSYFTIKDALFINCCSRNIPLQLIENRHMSHIHGGLFLNYNTDIMPYWSMHVST